MAMHCVKKLERLPTAKYAFSSVKLQIRISLEIGKAITHSVLIIKCYVFVLVLYK